LGRRKRGWKAASALSLEALRRLVETKATELAARREELVAELATIDSDLATTGGAAPKRGPGRPRKTGRGPGRPPKAKRVGRPPGSGKAKGKGKRRGRKPGPKGQSELHNMIRSALSASSEPLKVADIAKKVLASGYKTKSKVFHLIVGQRLAEMKDVKKAARGLYTTK
jgi:hypothetical protein